VPFLTTLMKNERFDVLFVEPTVGFPIVPLVISELTNTYKPSIIAVIDAHNSASTTLDLFQRLNKTKVVPASHLIKQRLQLVRSQAGSFADNYISSRIKPDAQLADLHKLVFNGVNIGTYFISFLMRHNQALCIGQEQEFAKEYLQSLRGWLISGYILNEIFMTAGKSLGVFTHSTYFWGFVSDLLSATGHPSITFGGVASPRVKPAAQTSEGLTRPTLPALTSYVSPALIDLFPANMIRVAERTICEEIGYSTNINRLGKTARHYYYELIAGLDKKQLDLLSSANQSIRFIEAHAKAGSRVACMYLHSFNDNQFDWSYDGYNTLYEYFIEITRILTAAIPGLILLVRPHPDIFRLPKNDRIKNDLDIARRLIEEISEVAPIVAVLLPTVSNQLFHTLKLEKLAVTHHSPNIIAESLYMGTPVLASDTDFKVSISSDLILRINRASDVRGEAALRFHDRVSDHFRTTGKCRQVLLANMITLLTRFDGSHGYKDLIRINDQAFCLVAGESDLHHVHGPQCENLYHMSGVTTLEQYLDIYSENYGHLAKYTLVKEAKRIATRYSSFL